MVYMLNINKIKIIKKKTSKDSWMRICKAFLL